MIADLLNFIDKLFTAIIVLVFLIVGSYIFYKAIKIVYNAIKGFIQSFPHYLSKLIRTFLILTALLLSMGGAFAFFMGILEFSYEFYIFMDTEIGQFDEIFIRLIHLAEYLLIGITFFSIAKRLLLESYFSSENGEDQAQSLTAIPDLEKHIIGMVIATVSVAFIGFVVSSGDTADISLKIGIGIAIVITSLGLYLRFSYHDPQPTNQMIIEDNGIRLLRIRALRRKKS